MTTFVEWDKNYDVGSQRGFYVKRNNFRGFIYASNIEEGIVTISSGPGVDIVGFASIIEGCFDKWSNFCKEVCIAFNCDNDIQITGIKCVFNDTIICIADKNTKASQIVYAWRKNL